MKITPDIAGRLSRETAAPTAGETRTPARPAGELPRGPARAAPAPDRLNLLTKEGWLKPGLDIDIDNRASLYDLPDDLS